MGAIIDAEIASDARLRHGQHSDQISSKLLDPHSPEVNESQPLRYFGGAKAFFCATPNIPPIPRQGPATAREWSHVMYEDEIKHMSDIGTIDNATVVLVVVHCGH